MFKITSSLNGKIEEFQMFTQEQVDSAIDILTNEGYTVLMVSSKN